MTREKQAVHRVADRYIAFLAAQEAYASGGPRIASSGIPLSAVAAFAEHFYLPQHQGRVAFGGLVSKLKVLVDAFKRAPQLWERFKKLLHITGITDLPTAIKDLAARAYKILRGTIRKMFNSWPLRIYTLNKGKLKGINDLLDHLVGKSPKFKHLLDSAVTKVGNFGEMLRQQAPRLVGAAMVGIYLWIWLNVVEFEWDFKALVDAITGALTFPEFLSSLPGSALGALLNVFGFGTFTLLPISIAARVLYLVNHRYIEWSGQGFNVNWPLLRKDFGLDPERMSHYGAYTTRLVEP